MPELEDIEVVFADAPMQEHINVLQAKTEMSLRGWIFGIRLVHARDTKLFLGVEIDGHRPADWTDYLRNYLDIAVETAYRYQDCARWDRRHTIRWGVEKVSWLTNLVDLTVVDDTIDDVLALQLPLRSGGTKSGEEMTARELEDAYKLMKYEGRKADREVAVADDPELRRLKSLTTNVLSSYVKPTQVRVYKKDGEYLFDLRRAPVKEIQSIGSCLTRIPK